MAKEARALFASPMSAATVTSTRNWSGAARMNRTGRTWWSMHRRSISRRKSTPRCSSMTCCDRPRMPRLKSRLHSSISSPISTACQAESAKTEFYQHDANWSNRMILGDSLQVMASLAEREGLRGKVQCIYIDPPYGIKFNSNFQWSTTSRDVKGRQYRSYHPRTGAGQGISGYLAGWDSFISDLFAGSVDRCTGFA